MRSRMLASTALTCLAISVVAQVPSPAQPSQMLGRNDPAREERLKWFRDAKYGLFIHWGLYTVAAGEWKGRRSLGLGEWVMFRSQVPVDEFVLKYQKPS